MSTVFFKVLSSVAKDEGMLSLYQAFRSGSENSPPGGFFEHCKDNQVDHSNKCNLSGEFEIPVDVAIRKGCYYMGSGACQHVILPLHHLAEGADIKAQSQS